MEKTDLTGQKFGRLTVLKKYSEKNRGVQWECVCDCGNITIITGSKLKNRQIRTCGCDLTRPKYEFNGIKVKYDLTGKKVNMLTVLQVSSERKWGAFSWDCLCDCGNKVVVRSDMLIHNTIKSCGCHKNEVREDLTGKKFFKLTVVKRSEERNKDGLIQWDCVCDCGGTITTVAYTFRKGYPKTCGCEPSRVSQKENLTGMKFNRLLVLEEAPKKGKRIRWKCICDCGNTTIVGASCLKGGKTKSCGCLRTEIDEDLVGKTFGRLTVIKENIEMRRLKPGRGAIWDCVCACGKAHTVVGQALRYGEIKSCGCLQREIASAMGKIRGCDHLRGYEPDRVDGISVESLTRGMLRNNTSGYKGVSWSSKKGKWRAYITIRDKQKSLGNYDDILDAVKARKEAEDEIFKPIVDKYEEAGGRKKYKRKMPARD